MLKDRDKVMQLRKYLNDAWEVGKQKNNWNDAYFWYRVRKSVVITNVYRLEDHLAKRLIRMRTAEEVKE